MLIKIGREEPVASMDNSGKIIWARHNEIQTVNVKSLGADHEDVCPFLDHCLERRMPGEKPNPELLLRLSTCIGLPGSYRQALDYYETPHHCSWVGEMNFSW